MYFKGMLLLAAMSIMLIIENRVASAQDDPIIANENFLTNDTINGVSQQANFLSTLLRTATDVSVIDKTNKTSSPNISQDLSNEIEDNELQTSYEDNHVRLRNQRLMEIQTDLLRRIVQNNTFSLTDEMSERAAEAIRQYSYLFDALLPVPSFSRLCYSTACIGRPNAMANRQENNLQIRLNFPITSEMLPYSLQAAFLHLFLKLPNDHMLCRFGVERRDNCQRFTGLLISAFQFLTPHTAHHKNLNRTRRRLLDTVYVSPLTNQWVSFNVIRAVHNWIRNRQNYTIEVIVKVGARRINAKPFFIPEDCLGFREVGCREESLPTSNSSPFLYNNFPFMELIMLPPSPSHLTQSIEQQT